MATAVPSTTGLLSRGSNHLSSLRLTERWENFRNSFQGHKVLQHFLQGQYHFSRRTCKAFHRTSSHLRCHIESSCNSVQHALSTSLAKTTDILKNAPYLFAKTPDEYSREARDRLDGQWVIVKSPAGPFGQEQQVLSAPHRRTVRVKLHRDLAHLYLDSALYIDVPLNQSGELDLRTVKRRWNLQNCFATDSSRVQIFESKNPDILSPLAVQVLTTNQYWLRVIEYPSVGRQTIRHIRLLILSVLYLIPGFLAMLWEQPLTHALLRLLRGLSKVLAFFFACWFACEVLIRAMELMPADFDLMERLFGL